MKKFIIIIIIVGFLVITGFIIADGLDITVAPVENTQEKIIDKLKNTVSEKEELSANTIQNCGNDLSCFAKAVNECSPAIGTFISVVTTPNYPILTTNQTFEVKKTNDGCSLSQEIHSKKESLSPEMKSSLLAQGATETQINQALDQDNAIFQEEQINKKGTCIFSDQMALNKHFGEIQKQIRGEDFSTSVYSHREATIGADSCFGPLYE